MAFFVKFHDSDVTRIFANSNRVPLISITSSEKCEGECVEVTPRCITGLRKKMKLHQSCLYVGISTSEPLQVATYHDIHEFDRIRSK